MRPLSHPGAAFLDRDGTINIKAAAGRYVTEPAKLHLIQGSAMAIRRLNDADVKVIVITNQRGIALGQMTERDLFEIHQRLELLLESEAQARVDAIMHCPHERDTCNCRKPAPGMLLRAKECWPWIDFSSSVMIGDSASDVKVGEAVGAKTIRIGEDATDLADAVGQALYRT